MALNAEPPSRSPLSIAGEQQWLQYTPELSITLTLTSDNILQTTVSVV